LIIFGHFSFKKIHRNFTFLLNTLWCQDVHIGCFIIRRCETVYLYKALLHQLLETVVKLAQADAHLLSHLALGEVGVFAEELKEAVAYFVIVCVHEVKNGLRFEV